MIEGYAAFNDHRIGTAHISRGMVCEDYSLCFENSEMAVAVISDGHGDRNCFRSARGSYIACHAAVEQALKYHSPSEKMISEIEKSILSEWKKNVIADCMADPVREEELSDVSEEMAIAVRGGSRLLKAYGATLIMAVFTKDFWYAVQIGDGRFVSVYDNGVYKQPIPWDDERCVGNYSTSLCDDDAISEFRYACGSRLPLAVFMGSDGVDESFDGDGLYKFYYMISNWYRYLPMPEFRRRLHELLGKVSAGGSADDVSVSGIVNFRKEIRLPGDAGKEKTYKIEHHKIDLTKKALPV